MTAISLKRNNNTAYEMLSDDFKQAIEQSQYDETLALISKNHKLHIDQSAKLEGLLSKIVFGEIEASSIIDKLKEEVEISTEEARKIADDINEQIIQKIKENLRVIQES